MDIIIISLQLQSSEVVFEDTGPSGGEDGCNVFITYIAACTKELLPSYNSRTLPCHLKSEHITGACFIQP